MDQAYGTGAGGPMNELTFVRVDADGRTVERHDRGQPWPSPILVSTQLLDQHDERWMQEGEGWVRFTPSGEPPAVYRFVRPVREDTWEFELVGTVA